MRGGRIFRRQCAADAVWRAGRGAARLPRRGVVGAGGGAAVARPGSGEWSTPWASRSTARARCRRAPMPLSFRAPPPPAHARRRVGAPIDLGVRALNTFITCCHGQRMGIFSGSGVGKSVLLSMLARNVVADVSVIGLIGERGREVQEFLQDDLGDGGLARSVVVVATSDEPALMRRQAGLSDAGHRRILPRSGPAGPAADGFGHPLCGGAARDRARHRRAADRQRLYADGVRGIAPAAGARRHRRRARAPSPAYSRVLVEGDDHNEPIADAVRAILDGHIVMERAIAERGRYPAINVLKSVSRSMPRAADPAYLDVLARARKVDGDLFRHGGADPAWRLPARIEPRGRRGHRAAPAAGGLPGPEQGRIHRFERGISAACRDLRRRPTAGSRNQLTSATEKSGSLHAPTLETEN